MLEKEKVLRRALIRDKKGGYREDRGYRVKEERKEMRFDMGKLVMIWTGGPSRKFLSTC